MKGSIVRRGKDRYAVILEMRDPETGKRKRKWHAFHGTRSEADSERRRLLTELEGGRYIEPSKTKLSEYLSEWLNQAKSRVSPRTHQRYCELVNVYLTPALGDVIMTKLRPVAVSAAMDKIRGMRTKGEGDLSPRTILHCHRVLSAALRQAVRWDLLPKNPAMDVKAPKVERRQHSTYSLTQVADVLEALRDSWMHVPALLGAMCGMRRGEIAALRWGSVDLETGQLAITQSAEQIGTVVRLKETKSGQARTIALSAAVVAELRAHRAKQAEAMLRLGYRLDGTGFVVAQADGQPYDPDSISKEWRLQIIKSGLPRLRFHDLRHSAATIMLGANIHPKIVSERLGHSRVSITLDTYQHATMGMQAQAVAQVDDAMAKALQKRAAERNR